MSDKINPYAVTTEYLADTTYSQSRPRWKFVETLTIVSGAAVVIGTAVGWWQIATIVFSGPIMVLVGVVMMFSTRKRSKNYRWVSYAFLAYPLIVFLTVNWMSWGPPEAQVPVSIMNTLFTGYFFAHLLYTVRTHRSFYGSSLEEL